MILGINYNFYFGINPVLSHHGGALLQIPPLNQCHCLSLNNHVQSFEQKNDVLGSISFWQNV